MSHQVPHNTQRGGSITEHSDMEDVLPNGTARVDVAPGEEFHDEVHVTELGRVPCRVDRLEESGLLRNVGLTGTMMIYGLDLHGWHG